MYCCKVMLTVSGPVLSSPLPERSFCPSESKLALVHPSLVQRARALNTVPAQGSRRPAAGKLKPPQTVNTTLRFYKQKSIIFHNDNQSCDVFNLYADLEIMSERLRNLGATRLRRVAPRHTAPPTSRRRYLA